MLFRSNLMRVVAFIFFICARIVSAQSTEADTLAELMRRVDILTQEIEKSKLGETGERKYERHLGMGPAASQVYQLKKAGVSLAGYGEILYQNFSKNTDAGAPASAKDQVDYVRHILYVGFRFNDFILFNSELEVEHGSTGKGGEVSMEFGYVEAQLASALNVRAGMVLVPVGIVNELHEPPTFFSTLRPETESAVIPTTWRANGFGIVGATNSGLGYKLYVVEGLDASKFTASGIRGGRQSGARSLAEDLGITGRLDYSGVPGVNLGASFYTGNSGQGLKDAANQEIAARVTIFSAHGQLARRGLELRALYARSTIAAAAALNAKLPPGSQSIGSKQRGFYLTAGYDVLPLIFNTTQHALAPFVQFEKVDTQAEVPATFSRNKANERKNLTYGLVYKPHPNVAFKIDYLNRDNEAGTATDQFNVAVNYLF
jgi:hypothetical protein